MERGDYRSYAMLKFVSVFTFVFALSLPSVACAGFGTGFVTGAVFGILITYIGLQVKNVNAVAWRLGCTYTGVSASECAAMQTEHQ